MSSRQIESEVALKQKLIILTTLSLFLLNGGFARPLHSPTPIRLAVILVFDQFRSDYLTRFSPYFLPAKLSNGKVGGFRFLMENGANFVDCRFDHYPLETAPGHAVISTGGDPYKTGIVANNWYNSNSKKETYVVADDAYGQSPRNLFSTTIGDELKLATGEKSKVVALSLKDRAAILLGGFTANTVLWFDSKTGGWVTSSFYTKVLPNWVKWINDGGRAQSFFGKRWKPLASSSAYHFSRTTRMGQSPKNALGIDFPHPVTGGEDHPGEAYYDALLTSPYGNDLTWETATASIQGEQLGQHDVPDLLAVNFASHDYIGHVFGPFSPEAEDAVLRADRALSDFLNYLNRTVPGGLQSVLLVATGDHGVAPIPEYLQSLRIPSYRLTTRLVEDMVERDFTAHFGPGPWVADFIPPYLYFDQESIAKSHLSQEMLEKEAVRILSGEPWIEAAFGKTQILEGRLPRNAFGTAVAKSFVPGRSGDVVLIPRIYEAWYASASAQGTTHLTPYSYDTHVPLLLFGRGVRPGIYAEPVKPNDIAPTFSFLLNTQFPPASEGRILKEALR